MIGCGVVLCVLSMAFFVLWQYFESSWLLLGYILAVLVVCGVYFVVEKRKQHRILERLEQILRRGSADYIADERLTPTERTPSIWTFAVLCRRN